MNHINTIKKWADDTLMGEIEKIEGGQSPEILTILAPLLIQIPQRNLCHFKIIPINNKKQTDVTSRPSTARTDLIKS